MRLFKNHSRFLAMVLSLVMCLGLCVPAFAEGVSGTYHGSGEWHKDSLDIRCETTEGEGCKKIIAECKVQIFRYDGFDVVEQPVGSNIRVDVNVNASNTGYTIDVYDASTPGTYTVKVKHSYVYDVSQCVGTVNGNEYPGKCPYCGVSGKKTSSNRYPHSEDHTFQVNATYTLNFAGEGVSIPSKTQTVAATSYTFDLPTPTREGYTFKGWDGDGTVTWPETSKTLTAQWEPIDTRTECEKGNHVLTKVEAKPADCVNAGNDAYWFCTGGCGGRFSDAEGKNPTTLAAVTIAATGHSAQNTWTDNCSPSTEDENCTGHTWTCTNCNGTLAGGSKSEAHTYGGWEWNDYGGSDHGLTLAANQKAQIGVHYCTVCNHKEFAYQAVAKSSKTVNIQYVERGNATGNVLYRDSVTLLEGDTYTIEEKSFKGYDYESGAVTVSYADVENNAYLMVYYTRCKHTNTVNVVGPVEPTCLTDGTTAGKKCADCDEVVEKPEVIGALGHNLVDDEAVAPTCTETGLTAGEHCVREGCGYTKEQEEVPALGHIEVRIDHRDPTCTADGVTNGVVCGREGCEAVLTAQTTVPALGHLYGEATQIAGNNAVHRYTCGRDESHTYVETHTYGEWSEWVNDVRTRTCDECGYEQADARIPTDAGEPVVTPVIPVAPVAPVTPAAPAEEDIDDNETPMAEEPEEEEIAESEVPMAAEPAAEEEEIAEPEVPMAAEPAAEEEIADTDVPMADVPKTSDLSVVWYATTALSALGLTVLGRKKEENDD